VDNAQVILDRYDRIRNDPWEFLKTCVYTLDQVDLSCPIKKFPAHFGYLYAYTRCWQAYPRILVPKSRRMFMSWENIALYLWDAMFHSGRFEGFVSRKEEAADDLVKRAEFIYDHIPEDVIPRDLLPRKSSKFCNLIFPDINSQIQGFPQGADQLRQFTFSGILGDEMAFWEHAQAMYSSSVPTLEGGGRFTGVSSPAPGFFKAMVHDELDTFAGGSKLKLVSGGTKPKFQPTLVADRYPMDGVEVWVNPKNKFMVFQLHYSANPEKRDVNYRNKIRSEMPSAQYMQEYELQWDSFSGLPVYPDFVERTHASKEKILPLAGLPLLRGWDFGLTPACVVAQLQGDTLVVLWEKTAKNQGAESFVPEALAACNALFVGWSDKKNDWRDFADPSGVAQKDTDMGSCFKIMGKNGLNVIPGAVAWEPRRSSVESFLIRNSRTGPCFQIVGAECPVLMRGFRGGYRYPEKAEKTEPTKIRPLKDEHSHPHDALQMITSVLLKQKHPRGRPIPTPQYGFMTRDNKREEVAEVPA